MSLTPDNGPLVYVRSRLAAMKAQELTRIAAESDLSLRVVCYIRDGQRSGLYTTVMRLHDLLKQKEAEAVAAKPAKRVRK